MKPFLLLSVRADDAAADNEYAAFLGFSGLTEGGLRRFRLDREPLGPVSLREWSGILLGGGPFNYTEPAKSAVQRRVEADLASLLDAVVGADFPFLGACYGIGALGSHQGAVLDGRYAEPVGAVQVTLTGHGRSDPLMRGLPPTFEAFTGHKEAISKLPEHATLLASSAACPVQAFRVGQNVYATQFHPELDVDGICTRIEVYRHAGYFAPHEADEVKARAAASTVTRPPAILRQFAERYHQRGARRAERADEAGRAGRPGQAVGRDEAGLADRGAGQRQRNETVADRRQRDPGPLLPQRGRF